MRKGLLSAALLVCLLASPMLGASDCPIDLPKGTRCPVPKEVREEARKSFDEGLRLEREEKTEEALLAFRHATSLVPLSLLYANAREVTLQRLVYRHMQAGNDKLLAGKTAEAMAEFRAALELDPSNQFARQQLDTALGVPRAQTGRMRDLVLSSEEVRLKPKPGRHAFAFEGDTRGLFEKIARTCGIRVSFDQSVSPRRVKFGVEAVDCYRALDVAALATKTFWIPAAEDHALVATDTSANRRELLPMAVRTFYLPGGATPEQINQLVGVLRSVFELRFVSPNAAYGTVTVRADERMLDAVTRFLGSLEEGPPQVLLDVKVFEVNRSLLQRLGVNLPLEFQLFNIPTEVRNLLGQPGVQDLIDQLIASGGINQADPTVVAALLAQLQNQQSALLGQPIAAFGGGITLMGLLIPPASVNLELNESRLSRIQHMVLRASQGNDATMHVGSRFPVLNTTFAPIFNSPQLSRVLRNQTFQTFPSFNYEDLGITLKANPRVQQDQRISLKLELNVRALSGQQLNSIPVISNREYTGSILLEKGEAAVVTGMVSRSESGALSGPPGLSKVPGVGRLVSSTTTQDDSTELLVVVTPHIASLAGGDQQEIWFPVWQ